MSQTLFTVFFFNWICFIDIQSILSLKESYLFHYICISFSSDSLEKSKIPNPAFHAYDALMFMYKLDEITNHSDLTSFLSSLNFKFKKLKPNFFDTAFVVVLDQKKTESFFQSVNRNICLLDSRNLSIQMFRVLKL